MLKRVQNTLQTRTGKSLLSNGVSIADGALQYSFSALAIEHIQAHRRPYITRDASRPRAPHDGADTGMYTLDPYLGQGAMPREVLHAVPNPSLHGGWPDSVIGTGRGWRSVRDKRIWRRYVRLEIGTMSVY